MARLNEIPMSSDSLETLRKKMLRQNRDLAKSNNIRALRIRELENECACMLSENLELRGRILELEKQVEDNEARRIADHALAIKARLESQLTEWGTLLAGLGLEPPSKRHSPRIRKSAIKQRMSFSACRPSPSQRRLRDVAREIEDLGHISENKSYPRMSLNPEQILALRSEADFGDSVDSPELGPPPMSHFIEEEHGKIASPSRGLPVGPKASVEPPVALPSPEPEKDRNVSPSPREKAEPDTQPRKREKEPIEIKPKGSHAAKAETVTAPPAKTGSKRKLASRDASEKPQLQVSTDENLPPRATAGKVSIREKAEGKTLRELATIRKEMKQRPAEPGHTRKPLAAKSTNDDITSPKKTSKPGVTDEVAAVKADLTQSKPGQDRSRKYSQNAAPGKIAQVPTPNLPRPNTVDVVCEPDGILQEPVLLSPSSPEPLAAKDGPRGDTPPPADISSLGETSRPSRRNRTAISYAEPNLRDKMRRPTKELCDAVAGEGKYSRRSSQCESLLPDTTKVHQESDPEASWKHLPSTDMPAGKLDPDGVPVTLASDVMTPSPEGVVEATAARRKRPSTVKRASEAALDNATKTTEHETESSEVTAISGEGSEVDIYEFTTSSPQPEKQESTQGRRKTTARQARSSRRFSAAVENDEGAASRGSSASRRRSMML